MNIKDQKQAHSENNSNLRTPLLNGPTFGTLQWITKEGWPVLPKREESNKRTPEVSENSNNRNIVDHNLLGLFASIFSQTNLFSN